MKKLILLLCFLLVTSLSYAESWTHFGVDDEGNNYYITSHSIRVNQSYGGNSVTNITVKIKLDNKSDPETYEILEVAFYETGWEELKSIYLYHKGTGKVLEHEEYIDGPQEKMEPGSMDYKISENLFAKYKERIKQEKQQREQKNKTDIKDNETKSALMYIAIIVVVLGFLMYLVEKKK